MTTGQRVPGAAVNALILLAAATATLGGIWGGPALGDHEAIVAQCARNMRISGDWIVPRFRESNFLRKPPLGYWLVASSSYLFGNDPATGLPVTQTAARFPSALAALGTVLLLWKLSSSMFGSQVGRATAVVASASILILLFSPNATVEMLLAFCCTWAFAHFWFATVHGYRTPRGLLHLFLYYVALGVGMLAKGPAPLAMVAVPLAVWWFGEAGLRVLSRGGRHNVRNAIFLLLRRIPRQTVRAFTRLWLFPGIFVFLAMFVPWMLLVAKRQSYALDLWDWQYLQRFQGDYEDTKARGALYFVPIALGLLVPWTLSFIEGLAWPFVGLLARRRRAFFYAAIWGCVGIAVMSSMTFKKPYYIVPSVPGLLLITGVAVHRFFSRAPGVRWLGATIVGLMAVGIAVGIVWLRGYLAENMPGSASAVLLMASGTGLLVVFAGVLHVMGRGWLAMGMLTAATIGGFLGVWNVAGSALDNVDRIAALDQQLDAAGVPADAVLYWADQRPDARLEFYFGRRSAHLVDPAEVVTRWVDRTKIETKMAMLDMVTDRLKANFAKSESFYLLVNRRLVSLLDQDPTVMANARILCTVNMGTAPDDHDWIIFTNRRS